MPYTDADIEQLIRQMATSKDVEVKVWHELEDMEGTWRVTVRSDFRGFPSPYEASYFELDPVALQTRGLWVITFRFDSDAGFRGSEYTGDDDPEPSMTFVLGHQSAF